MAAVPSNLMVFYCKRCGGTFERKAGRGRKPHYCVQCREQVQREYIAQAAKKGK